MASGAGEAAAGRLAEAMARVEADFGGAAAPALPRAEAETLAAAAPDSLTLRRWLKRRMAGEPMAYILGGFEFRGLRLQVDRRAYVTDPETTHLVDQVARRVDALAPGLGRPLLAAEFGVGCGSLALALKASRPDISVVGVDIDPGALQLAAANAAALGLEVRLLEADLFEPWPADLPPPDIVFGDPPWGDEESLYADDRPAEHYAAMPAASAFPLGGNTGLHAQLLRAVARLGWTGEVWLNCGVLPDSALRPLQDLARWSEIVRPAPGLSLLGCRM